MKNQWLRDGCVRESLIKLAHYLELREAKSATELFGEVTRVTDTALGTIRSLESTVQGFEERVGRLESDIKDSQKRATELEAKVGSPFEKEERYHKLVSRQSEIEEQLDLTKNQAPSQLEAMADNEIGEKNLEQQSQMKSNRQSPKTSVHI